VTTLAEALAATAAELREAGVPSPDVDARWLVEAATGVDPRRVPDRVLTDDESRTLIELRARRRAREPLQLVIGTAAFREIELRCQPGVFVPRPETEVLAGLAITVVRGLQAGARGRTGRPIVVHEPCCGTGAIGLAVASEVDGALLLLGDRSDAAVTLATENRDLLAAAGTLRSSVEVVRGDLLEAFTASPHGAADVIVANPPYLPASDLAGSSPRSSPRSARCAVRRGGRARGGRRTARRGRITARARRDHPARDRRPPGRSDRRGRRARRAGGRDGPPGPHRCGALHHRPPTGVGRSTAVASPSDPPHDRSADEHLLGS
jgi:HemK-like putative methylase